MEEGNVRDGRRAAKRPDPTDATRSGLNNIPPWWTARATSGNRLQSWPIESGSSGQVSAAHSAAFYRTSYHKRCVSRSKRDWKQARHSRGTIRPANTSKTTSISVRKRREQRTRRRFSSSLTRQRSEARAATTSGNGRDRRATQSRGAPPGCCRRRLLPRIQPSSRGRGFASTGPRTMARLRQLGATGEVFSD
jgi:hypothetical protein